LSAAYESVRKLAPADSTEGFDCGQPPLNQFLQRYALVMRTHQDCNVAREHSAQPFAVLFRHG
jgi:hypothetical protein